MEIERKFLIESLGSLPLDLQKLKSHEISQYYLSFDPEIRMRKIDDCYFETSKKGSGLEREEVEANILEAAYGTLKEARVSNEIKKVRYLYDADGYLVEIDVYCNDLEGLIVAEVEFSTTEEAMGFVVPTWFGPEITLVPEYRNQSLAINGLSSERS